MTSKAIRRSFQRAKRLVQRTERQLTSRRLILMYHRVDSTVSDPWQLCIGPQDFDDQIAHLRGTGDVEPLRAVASRSTSGALRRRPRFAVTFDDGYLCNLETALPILEKHDVPATVFVPSAFVGAPYFWWDRLVWTVSESGVSPHLILEWWSRERPHERVTPRIGAEDGEVLASVYEHLAELPPSNIICVLDELSSALALPTFVPAARPVGHSELARLAAHPLIDIGGHTANHRRLTSLTPAHCREEILTGMRGLDELLRPEQRTLAYPYGKCNRAVAEAASSAGIDVAVTTRADALSQFDDPRLLPRAVVPPVLDRSGAFDVWLGQFL